MIGGKEISNAGYRQIVPKRLAYYSDLTSSSGLVRRSARGQKSNPEAAHAESNLSSELTTAAIMEDVPDSFELVISPSKANNLKQAECDRSFSGSSIYGIDYADYLMV